MLKYQQQQADFAAYIRNPEKKKGLDPSIEERRLNIYSELFFNNIEGFLSNGFPVLKSLMNQSQWLLLARTFLQNHHCQSPYFLDICEEFLQYLSIDDCPIYHQLPELAEFLFSLAQYEWLELAVSVAQEDFEMSKADFPLRPWQSKVIVSELIKPAAYAWPVHEISNEWQPTEAAAEPFYYLVYRNRAQEVAFMTTNAATLRLLELCQTLDAPLQQVLNQLAQELQQQPENLESFVLDLLKQLHQLDIISHFE